MTAWEPEAGAGGDAALATAGDARTEGAASAGGARTRDRLGRGIAGRRRVGRVSAGGFSQTIIGGEGAATGARRGSRMSSAANSPCQATDSSTTPHRSRRRRTIAPA